MLGFKIIQETRSANVREWGKDAALIIPLFPSNFCHPWLSALRWPQHRRTKAASPTSPTYWSSQLRSCAVYHLHLLIAHFLLLLAIKHTLWPWTFLVIPLNGYTRRGKGKLMFKLTITSSGKYLALWQIKPIGLHDGHLLGGEDADFDIVFFSFFLFFRSRTIMHFTVISL